MNDAQSSFERIATRKQQTSNIFSCTTIYETIDTLAGPACFDKNASSLHEKDALPSKRENFYRNRTAGRSVEETIE